MPEFDFQNEAFWVKAYRAPDVQDAYSIVLSTSQPAGVEVMVVNLLWKSGGTKRAGAGQFAWQGYPMGGPNGQCTYHGSWDIPPRTVNGVVKALLSSGVLESYQRQPQARRGDAQEVSYKIQKLKEERGILASASATLPASLGLLDAELANLEALSARFALANKNARVTVCIKPE